MSIADKITALSNAKTAIAESITAKGGTVNSGDGFSDFAADIATIASGGFDTSGITDFSYFCYGNRFNDQLSEIDTSNGTNFLYFCMNCSNLTVVPLFDFSKGTQFLGAFTGCSKLVSVPNFDVSLGTGYQSMYYGCSRLAEIDITNYTKIDAEMFKYDGALVKVISHATTVTPLVSTNAFQKTAIYGGTGYIYVPDALVDSYKSATNWSYLATQIKGLSELPT